MQDVQRIWDEALGMVKGELNTPAFKTWFEHASPLGVVDETLVVSVHNEFAADWLHSRYSSMLSSALTQVSGNSMGVTFTAQEGSPDISDVAGEEEPEATSSRLEEVRVSRASMEGSFDPKHTFDAFVMGSSNRFAHAAAQAVAETPGKAYNPLFIYGGVGLGKTHLLQAVGHYVGRHMPHLKVKYVSTEQFTNDFINSLAPGNQQIDGFRRQYRTNDVLLVDDIQFLAGKEGTQEEFFHTFNTLQQAGKQIVLSSDRPPKDIATLEDRLTSRFNMGLIIDIQPPDLETRIAILRKKIEGEDTPVPDEVLAFVAGRVSSNIRELEGAWIRIVAFSSLTRHPIDLDLARSVLKDIFPDQRASTISITSIQHEVSRYYGVSKGELVGKKRSHAVVYPRQMAMYLSRELTDLSLPRIGQEFGGKDHTTVIHANQKIQKLMNSDRKVFDEASELTNRIRQRTQ